MPGEISNMQQRAGAGFEMPLSVVPSAKKIAPKAFRLK